MNAKIGDLIRIKDVNMLSLYYSVQKITNVIEHPVSKRNGYVFKINEQEIWVDDSQAQILMPEEDKSTEVEKLVSLRVTIDSISSLIRSFGVSDPLFDYCSEICANNNSLDPDYQKIISDYQTGKEIDKTQLTVIMSSYYDVLDSIEKALSAPEVTKNIFIKLIDSLQKVKSEYFPVVAQNIQLPPSDANIQSEAPIEAAPVAQDTNFDVAPIEIPKEEELTPSIDPNSELASDFEDSEKSLEDETEEDENSIENVDLEKEEITEKLNFLKSLLNEEGIDKTSIENEIKVLEESLGSLLSKATGGDGKYYLVGVLDHSGEVFIEGPKDSEEDFDNALKMRNKLVAVHNKTAASKMKVIVGKKSAEKYKAELEKVNESNMWFDVLGLIVPPLIATMGIVGALAAGKDETIGSDFSPKESPTVIENIEEIYSRFKEFLNQASDKAAAEWKKLTAPEFEKLIDDRKVLPEIQKTQLLDLFNVLKEHEAETK